MGFFDFVFDDAKTTPKAGSVSKSILKNVIKKSPTETNLERDIDKRKLRTGAALGATIGAEAVRPKIDPVQQTRETFNKIQRDATPVPPKVDLKARLKELKAQKLEEVKETSARGHDAVVGYFQREAKKIDDLQKEHGEVAGTIIAMKESGEEVLKALGRTGVDILGALPELGRPTRFIFPETEKEKEVREGSAQMLRDFSSKRLPKDPEAPFSTPASFVGEWIIPLMAIEAKVASTMPKTFLIKHPKASAFLTDAIADIGLTTVTFPSRGDGTMGSYMEQLALSVLGSTVVGLTAKGIGKADEFVDGVKKTNWDEMTSEEFKQKSKDIINQAKAISDEAKLKTKELAEDTVDDLLEGSGVITERRAAKLGGGEVPKKPIEPDGIPEISKAQKELDQIQPTPQKASDILERPQGKTVSKKASEDVTNISNNNKLKIEGSFEPLPLSRLENFRRTVEDFNIPLKTLQRDIQKATGKDIPEYLDLYAKRDLLPRVNARRVSKIEEARESFVKGILKDDLRVDELDEYLKALHAPERNARIRKVRAEQGKDVIDAGSGMTDAQAKEFLDSLTPERKAVLDKHAKVLRKQIDDTLDFQVEQGLLSADDAKTIRSSYQNYVPLGRDVEKISLGTGQGIDIRGKEVKRAKGSEDLRVVSPTAQIFQAAQKAQVRALKNDVGKTIVGMVDEYPFLKNVFEIESQKFLPRYDETGELIFMDPKFQVADDIIGVKADGKQKFIKVKNPEVLRALKQSGMAELDAFSKTSRKMVQLWSRLTTGWNPEFWITNFQRDSVEGLMNLSAAKRFGKQKMKGVRTDFVKGIVPAQRQIRKFLKDESLADPLTKEFFDVGGDTGHFWLQDIIKSEKSLETLQKELIGKGADRIKNPIKKFLSAIDDLNSIIELGTRLSAYKALRKRGVPTQKAVQEVAELTVNFTRQGELTPFMKSYFAFINPSIQGASKVFKTLATSKEAQTAAAGLMFLGFANRYLQDNLKEDDSIPEWIKNRQIALEFPEDTPGVGGKTATFWNMSYGYSPFFSLGVNAYDVASQKKTPEEGMKEVLETTATAFSPVEMSLAGMTPTIASPFVEIGINENFMGSPIHPENPFKRPKTPNYLETFKNTTEFSKDITKLMFELSGGNIDVFPGDLDHLWDSYTSGTGKFINNTIDFGIKKARGEEVDPGRIPFARKFVRGADRDQMFKTRDIIFDTLDFSGKRQAKPLERSRFFEALDKAKENEFLEPDVLKKREQEFFKGQYKFSGTITGEENIRKIFEMPKEDRNRFIKTYSPKTQKTILKKAKELKSK